METFDLDCVKQILSAHIPLYSWHSPIYQYATLTSLRRLWDASHRTALDVGGGTGILAQTVKTLFSLERVVSVDVEDRFIPSLDIETAVYDGVTLPFPDRSFDCILMFNVLHHVPPSSRVTLLRECRRVTGGGPIYIKDHISTGPLDDVRLTVLDFLGNVPFGGMLRANYLRKADWDYISEATGYAPIKQISGAYRSRVFGFIFPNRLETSMKWHPI
jgi:ubiquinone/menaquinone biosynthesis C-methylase UbiE